MDMVIANLALSVCSVMCSWVVRVGMDVVPVDSGLSVCYMMRSLGADMAPANLASSVCSIMHSGAHTGMIFKPANALSMVVSSCGVTNSVP